MLAVIWFAGSPAAPVGAQDSGDLPPARIEQLPTWHGGSLFTFELHFSENTNLSFRTVRDDLFEVDGGSVTRAPRIDKSSNQSWLVHVRPDGFGDVTISGLGMTASVPGPGDRLAARISELPTSHDGEEEFTARLDFNRSPDLKPRDVRGPVVVVTGGDVRRSPRVVKGDNAAWTLMITPDGDGTIGIAVPVTGSCGEQGDVCEDDGTMLADGAWRTVRGPERNALTRPQNTIGNTGTQPTIRPEEPAETEPEEAEPAGPTGADHQAAKTECAYTVQPTATSFTYNLDCDGQLTQFNAYLNHASKSHSYDERQVAYRTEGSGPANWTTVSGTNPASVSLNFSGTAIKYEVCIFPGGGSATVTANDHFCDNDSSGHSDATRGETRVIALSPGFKLDWDSVSWPRTQGGSLNLTETYTVGGSAVTVRISGHTNQLGSDSYPFLGDTLTGGLTPKENSLQVVRGAAPNSAETTTVTVDFGHTGGVSNVSFTLFDVDGIATEAQDRVTVTATAGGSSVNPTTITTSANNEQVSGSDNAVRGKGYVASTASGGNATFTFSQSGITRISIAYTNSGALNIDDTGYALHDITFQWRPPPTLSSPGNLNFIQNFDIKPVTFPAAQGGIAGYTYGTTNLPNGLSFNATSRVLSGTPTASGTTNIAYTAIDEDGSGMTSPPANFTITVESRVLPKPGNLSFKKDETIEPVTFPELAGSGSATLAAHTTVVSYTITPNLPNGLTFNGATRKLSGTPDTLHASSNFSYKVSNTHGVQLEAATFTIAVVETIDVPAVSDVYAYVGVPFSVTLPAVTDPTATGNIRYNVMGAPYNWGADWPDGPERSPGLPAGVTFTPSTRVLSGTPQHTVGNRRLAYGAEDANGAQGAAEFDLRIREPMTLAQPDDITVADGEAMVPVNLPRAEGGHSTYPDGYTFYDYSVSNLPFGLRYERFQHQIYGTPRYSRPPREVTVTLTATDTGGMTVRRTFTIEMLACSVTVDPIDDRTYHAGRAIDPVVLPEARGACGDVSYEVTGLPAGLEFDWETRTLSGTPDDFNGNEGDYLRHVEYVATDDRGSKTVEFTIVVPTVASVCGPNWDAARGWNPDYDTNLNLPDPNSEAWFKTATPNGRYTLPEATGGQGPYEYVVRGLPDGVCFDPETRAVFGTPPITRYPTVHWYFPDYLVRDANGDSRENYFKINVYD